MKNLIIDGTNDSPVINLNKDTGILYLGGSSLPENVLEVYNPVLNWLEEYLKKPHPETRAEFFFEYLNTASSHMMVRILQQLVQLKNVCTDFKITWFYVTGDPDMRHFGEELMDLTGFPIQLIARDLNF